MTERQQQPRPKTAEEMREALRAAFRRVEHRAAREREGERLTAELRQIVLR